MKTRKDYVRVSEQKLRNLCVELFKKVNLTDDDATIVADKLIETDLRGVYSHGISRVPIYLKRIEAKVNKPRPKIKVIRSNKASALIDGGSGMGQVVSHKAMELAIEKSRKFGISGIGVFGTNHNGAEAGYAMMALKHDMIGYCMTTGGRNIMTPFGGVDNVLGNNPFAFAIPTGNECEFPIVFDMACSVAARGRIILAMQKGDRIPKGWAVDKEGNPTTDSREAYEGSVLPVAEYKGYGLALIVGILSSVLSGGSIGEEITDMYGDFKREQNLGHFLGAINISHFTPVVDFKKRLDKLVKFIKSSRKSEGVEKIYLPGEKEYETYRVNLAKGIPLTYYVLRELKDLAKKYSIKWEI